MSKNIKDTEFYRFLSDNFEKGSFTNDDVVAEILPLLKTVIQIHNQGKVASLNDMSTIFIEDDKLNISTEELSVRNNSSAISKLFPKVSKAFEISGVYNQNIEIGDDVKNDVSNLNIGNDSETLPLRAVYLKDYVCFETLHNHHDPLTDIFILGMILASISLNFDFTEDEDLSQFVEYRKSMVFLNPKIHPAIANIILGMTELDRRKRWKDINEIIEKLKNYRDYNPETEYDLTTLAVGKAQNKNRFIHERLRNRLFDNSRRNRLLYYQPNLKFLNLTISSVPQVLNYQNINPNNIFYWNNEISEKLINGTSISLNKYLQVEDNPYITPTLDKIRLESNKDINEYGFSQLKLVLCFLNWYNTKEDSNEKIVSPLLLASVNLVKKKGVKDQYILEFKDSEVEINPVLSNMLKELYNIRLPETVQLAETGIKDIYQILKAQIESNNSGIVLDYVDKPKIKLIHSQARQTLSHYNKRNSKRQAIADQRNLSYSYSKEDFQPYGLEIFKNYVMPNASSLEYLINSDISLSPKQFNANKTIQREFYSMDEGDSNPFRWEFDTCNMVIGNFNYKKMSLVRDYNLILDENLENHVFNSLFNTLPQKEFKTESSDTNRFKSSFNVVPSDPTQNKAVKYSNAGESYIIQGPPGTGKSQTIANLVANFIANGKKVLFVCEKRAALDVVFYRLKNQGLDELCCLIHDSQADKKEFIFNLKKTFNSFTGSKNNFPAIEKNRDRIVNSIEIEIGAIDEFHQFMKNPIPGSSFTIKEIFDILISYPYVVSTDDLMNLDENAGYEDWEKYADILTKLYQINKDTNKTSFLSDHPLKYLNINSLENYSNLMAFKSKLQTIINTLDNLAERLDFIHLPQDISNYYSLLEFLRKCIMTLPFFENGAENLLIENSDSMRSLDLEITELTGINNEIETLAIIYPYWTNKLTELDARNAFEVIGKSENNFFKFLKGSYRNARKQMLAAYDISKHIIKPKLTPILENLNHQYILERKKAEKQTAFEGKYNLGNIFELKNQILNLNNQIDKPLFTFVQQLSKDQRKELGHLFELMKDLETSCSEFFEDYYNLSLTQLDNALQNIVAQQHNIPLYCSVFQELQELNPTILKLIKNKPLLLIQLKNILAEKSLQNYYVLNYNHKKFNMDMLHNSIGKIKNLYSELLAVNGKYIISRQINDLKGLIMKSEMSVAGMTEKEKQDKKSITEGRKILENEFNKSIRYKSIRELATAESGQLIRELKPVWLMSPLSVSDTLPINENYFDVVIFDEASQITLEEGLPPIFRAQQTIIVGDEMQMPPSNFFGSSSGNQDDLWSDEDEEENEFFSLDADSFLTQGARKFPSVMLGWHYRSKHEALIGFSNASFYNNQLLTIPDVKDHQAISPDIIVEDISEAKQNVKEIYSKPISYHYIKKGVYNARTNAMEAGYIANLVKELLLDKSGNSIGIVAFSMEQQNEIETAIEQLCIGDKNFENLLEEEYKREDENQFVGLFVKNLENVQGDERDIIIMSTCYGYDPKGKMLMNFGPINKRGGEKRLNVIFSRAKKSMCVVSSIKYFDIKNEYNEGASFFRKYLQYAELVSLGQLNAANNVLNAITNTMAKDTISGITEHVKKELETLGYAVYCDIGQSKFKCNLGIKLSQDDNEFVLGITIDDDTHYSNDDIMEQYLLKPEILKSNGWKICQVYSKDWLDNKGRVIKMIQSMLKDESFFEEIDHGILFEDKDEEIIPSIESLLASDSENQFDRYINTSDSSNKFWEICTNDSNVIVQYGRIGTKGQRMIKSYESEAEAQSEMKKLIAQKLAKEYYKA